MEEVFVYLKKFKNIKPPEKTKKKIVQSVIKQKLGFSIPLNNIFLKNKGIEINAPSVLKNEIRINSSFLIKELNKNNIDITYIG